MGGLTWALEGASTKAFGVGLVGSSSNSTATPSASGVPSGSASQSVAATTSGAAAPGGGIAKNLGTVAAAVGGAVGAGLALLL